ncbi:hypothetical protein ASPWEDRAFT_170596 [Aspergillus wentii DTO 134E9]|uniref:Sensitive to high expression protein 9, mitochondrial n=1 Tax=Aspergillus wentii DTO 134E9 TaxID=1073089 RepID=A0A1L9RQM0_ASPWE|nr:uncharacterized protein ASPWEDRAFT_170596 [Aspergillus wentii DTO 134E9]KAI9928404.1 sensitivity to high expression protein she9 [Aspergillus wentii]OJJ37107.1 hypothetical protein ASPWEDRAFT_170596 [Aspergillus wentii DTO 134E9]
MQSVPLLLRRPLRSSLILSRSSPSLRTQLPPSARPKALHAGRETTRNFSVCLQCQFRKQSTLYSSSETDKLKDVKAAGETKEAVLPEGIPRPDADAEAQRTTPFAEEGTVNTQSQIKDGEKDLNPDGAESGGLPSYIESRRSKYSKQFTEMMDNLQSNVFVAGQRLNDLTGYSSIEALKKEIHFQEERLRTARNHIREAKDAYAAAINRRSTSQREVNDLLQRKHAWSPSDLERFTHLYRNDHTNEVAENETQEALSAAEREAEEASASLSKSILSRYHEEQVWSDKIRRMSTWGTWGLMGMNVLLFLIFQIAVEPWRRKRLVKGFEEKVIEAIEKEKVLQQTETVDGQSGLAEDSSIPITSETSAANEAAANDAYAFIVSETQGTTDPNTITPDPLPATATTAINKNTIHCIQETCSRTLNDLLSDRRIVTTQRDLTTVAVQSAAAGAAVMGLLIALVRPR